jgi:hypothetical protein
LRASFTEEDFLLLASAIGDAAVWRDWRYFHNIYFVSDTLYEAMTSAGLSGFQPRKTFLLK